MTAGDAETGTGIELGGGLGFSDPARGLTVTAKARGLVAHEDTDYAAEWGVSGAVRIDPGAVSRGLSLNVSPAWGADGGGAERLWSAHDARGPRPERRLRAGRPSRRRGRLRPRGLRRARPRDAVHTALALERGRPHLAHRRSLVPRAGPVLRHRRRPARARQRQRSGRSTRSGSGRRSGGERAG